MNWLIQVSSRASKEIKKIPRPDIDRIRDAIDEMETDPFIGDIVYLSAHESDYRRRVGDWRIFFSLKKDERVIVIEHVSRRTSNTY